MALVVQHAHNGEECGRLGGKYGIKEVGSQVHLNKTV